MTVAVRGTAVVAITLALTSARVAAEDPGKPDLRCGGYCLYVALKALDRPVENYQAFEAVLGQPGRLGYSIDQLAVAARAFGAHAEAVETTVDHLTSRRGRFVCIALLDRGHFVNVYDVVNGQVYLVDPPEKKTVGVDPFRAIWGGKAILISNGPLGTAPASLTFGRWALASVATVAAVAAAALIFLKRH